MIQDASSKLIRAPKLSEQIARLLMDEIKPGSIGVGEKLPSEADLCSRFDVSRTIIREAIGRLEHDGLLEAKRGSRAVVTAPASRTAFRIEDFSSMDTAELAQLYEFRAIIEGSAVALMIKRADKTYLEKLKVCLDNMEEVNRSDSDGTIFNVEFHQLIAEASGNHFLRDFMLFLNDKISNMMDLDFKKIRKQGILKSVHEEHVAIYNAIVAGDSKSANQSIHSHILNAADRQGIKLEEILY